LGAQGFIVVVVGRMGSLGGSVAASILISLLEAYASAVVALPSGDCFVRRADPDVVFGRRVSSSDPR